MLEVLDFDSMNQKQKPSDVFLITKEFNTTTQFSQYIEEQAVRSDSTCMDILIDIVRKMKLKLIVLVSYSAQHSRTNWKQKPRI